MTWHLLESGEIHVVVVVDNEKKKKKHTTTATTTMQSTKITFVRVPPYSCTFVALEKQCAHKKAINHQFITIQSQRVRTALAMRCKNTEQKTEREKNETV